MKLKSIIFFKPLFLLLFFVECLNAQGYSILPILFTFQAEIGVDIMPSSHYIMNKQDFQRLRDEINHDVRHRISDIEDAWQANEAIREVSSGVWNMQGSTYPALYNNNGMGGLGQQAMKTYWENYAKAVDPLNYKRKIESQPEILNAENVADKIEDQMTNMNEKINSLKKSIKKSNDAAKSKLEINRPKTPLRPKNEAAEPFNTEQNVENGIVEKYKNNKDAEPNESSNNPNTANNDGNIENKAGETNTAGGGNNAAEGNNANAEGEKKAEEGNNVAGGNNAAEENTATGAGEINASKENNAAGENNASGENNAGEVNSGAGENNVGDGNNAVGGENSANTNGGAGENNAAAGNNASGDNGGTVDNQGTTKGNEANKGENSSDQANTEGEAQNARFLQKFSRQAVFNGPIQGGLSPYKDLYQS